MTIWKMARPLGALAVAALLVSPFGGQALAHGHGDDGMFQKMDGNGDGKISAEEHAAAAKAMFDAMDGSPSGGKQGKQGKQGTQGKKDGKVTAAEMEAAHEKIAGKTVAGNEKGKEMSAAEKIKVVDTNGDGVLTAEEHAAGSKSMFEKMDTNHDGVLTKTELEAGHEKMMHKAPK